MNIKKLNVNDLNPAMYNPRKDLEPNDPEYKKIKRSIQTFGYVDPIIINKNKNVIGGHQRLKVLKDLGFKDIDVVVVDLDHRQEKALNLALNKISGEWDIPKLKDVLQEIDTGEFDIEVTGFDVAEIESLLTQFHVPEFEDEDEKEDPEEEDQPKYIVCPSCKKEIEI